jgi:hypothetical protein
MALTMSHGEDFHLYPALLTPHLITRTTSAEQETSNVLRQH